ncbi:carboxymuconolactone decarboxylase family protein [Streptoverticillium reticulum]|uniref:carboxymuconolactone decarboxylase family protein n=1 Tax=Streptoverticillium reticulum TaxID=1433415 RepID=UPI0039BFC11D
MTARAYPPVTGSPLLFVPDPLRNGCTPEEPAEVALQCAVYAGAPAGIGTMKLIRQEVARFEEENGAFSEGS